MPDQAIRQRVLCKARSIVVKLGTNAITDDAGRLDRKVINALVRQIAAARAAGVSVTVVSSGAIGAGLPELDMTERPRTMPMLQAVAAVGQGQLMRAFHDAFARCDGKVAQVLVTADDFRQRTRYLNIRNTLAALRECGAIPIINENDAVAVDEIRFGDNDVIAALVTNLLGADALILLTSVDGVLDDGRVVDVVEKIDDARGLVEAGRSRLGSGGMGTKLEAAGQVTRAGRRWIGLASRPAGEVYVDAGAARALMSGGKSLLPSGITSVAGTFGKGATVSVVAPNGDEIARGLTNYSAEQIDKIRGLKTSQIPRVLGDKTYDEVIHRNNMALT